MYNFFLAHFRDDAFLCGLLLIFVQSFFKSKWVLLGDNLYLKCTFRVKLNNLSLNPSDFTFHVATI